MLRTLLACVLGLTAAANAHPLPPFAEALEVEIRELLSVAVQNEMLVLRSDFLTTDLVGSRVVVSDLDGETTLAHRPLLYRLVNTRQTPAGEVSLRVERRDRHVHIQRNTPGRVVVLIQAYEDGFGVDARGARLNVIGPGRQLQLSLVAPSFRRLVQAHPEEMILHMAPTFRELRSSALEEELLPMAQQVLADVPEDAGLRQEVERRVAELDSPSFDVREAAVARLAELGSHGRPIMAAIPRGQLSDQQQLALDQLLEQPDIPGMAAIARLRDDPQFLVECLYLHDEQVRTRAAARLGELGVDTAGFDPAGERDEQAIETIRGRISSN